MGSVDEDLAVVAQKVALRDQLMERRRRMSLLEVGEFAREIAEHLADTAELQRAATVAAYVSISKEPGTGPLLELLRSRGKRLIVPVLLPDNDLDWAVYDGPDSLQPAGRGLLEPAGPRLGVDAVATADVVLVPALAVDRAGMRIGRGGGSYDRVLHRVPTGTFVCALLYDGELLDQVPADDHDRRVTAVATPGGVTWLKPA